MPLFLVGDSDQNMYTFAGANPEMLMGEIEKYYPNIRTIKLTVNYRSTQTIINACSKLIANNYSDLGGRYNQELFKLAEAKENAPIGEPITYTWHDSVESECQSIANDIRLKLDSGVLPGSVFVGARTRAQLGYLEGELLRRQIPYINITGGSFWSSKVIADVVSYLALANDTSNKLAFEQVYNIASNYMVAPWGKNEGEYCNHRWLGKAFLATCQSSFDNLDRVYKKSFQAGIEDLQGFVWDIQDKMKTTNNPGDLIQFVIDECYKKYLQTDEGLTTEDEAENGKLSLLETLVDIASEFDTLESFLSFVEEAQKSDEAKKDKNWDDYVVLSTIHRLKGLERDIVYGMGWCEGEGCGLLPHTFSLIDPPQFGVLPTGGKSDISEERNLAFVLVSRAKLECHLSGCETYRKYVMHPSRFVYELGLTVESEE